MRMVTDGRVFRCPATRAGALDERGNGVEPGEVAGLIAAGAFLVLVLVLAVPILRMRHTVDAATRALNDLTDRTGPILGNVNTTVENVNTTLGQVQTSLDLSLIHI